MSINLKQMKQYLKSFEFARLMVEELGWNVHRTMPLNITVDCETYMLEAVAEKCGLVVYVCQPGPDGNIPPYPIRRKIERKVTNSAFEHMIIFTDADKTEQIWQWVKRQAGTSPACREHPYRTDQTGEALIQKLQGLAFQLDEEEELNIALVTARVQQQLDVERITKRFYDYFKREHQAFLTFIEGVKAQVDREWYASLMLNRMMFIYFIQKKGFLDGDLDYLRNRLQRIQAMGGRDRFQSFYRLFLLRLFHEGLGRPESERAPDLSELLGKVPYLNGGLFDVHELEKHNREINIPDEAFERLFNFFDAYTWHLDQRPLRADNEINPDVLGYIFEKYINQKQMGAYYTKEDITGYISRNTIIPYLFDQAEKGCKVAFQPDGGVWRLLKEEPDRYIYPAMLQGVDLELPEEIAAGLDDVSKRDGWNRLAGEGYGLPTETWREHVTRRKRCLELRSKLADGEITAIKDLVTYNLDICRFAEDVIIKSEGPELVKAFWQAISNISVLDPTCGSGAFLFAALNILEPLYAACLEGMQGFLDDLERGGSKHHPDKLKPFRDALKQVDKHPNRRYFILKSIIIGNLYGVDIMVEAVEICKLRLFLKLVAQLDSIDQIEPLPDMDFNIRPGNTLIGFTSLEAVKEAIAFKKQGKGEVGSFAFEDEIALLNRIDEDAEVANKTFNMFRRLQTKYDMDASEFRSAKVELQEKLKSLRDELDRYLAGEHKVDSDNDTLFENWRSNYQPFHWFIEFYGILKDGGFSVIIGNPPWREYSAVKKHYQVRNYSTESCGNLHGLCTERSLELKLKNGYLSFIVQLPLTNSARMQSVRDILMMKNRIIYFIPFDDRPGKLFDGLQHCRSTIFIAGGSEDKENIIFSSKYQRWYTSYRPYLFEVIQFVKLDGEIAIFPKIESPTHQSILKKVLREAKGTVNNYCQKRKSDNFLFYQEATQYWIKITLGLPYYSKNGNESAPAHGRYIFFENSNFAHSVCAIANSSLFYLYYLTLSDGFHLNDSLVKGFPIKEEILSNRELVKHNVALMKDLERNSNIKTINTKDGNNISYAEFSVNLSKKIIDEIDVLLSNHLGFTAEEIDYIINYDIKYRLGVDNSEE